MTAAPERVLFRSYSQLSTYKTCPEMYRLKYIERVPEVPSVWSVGGTAFHQFAEWYLRGELPYTPTDSMVADAWRAAWQIAADDQLRKYPDIAPLSWRAADRGREDAAWWQHRGLQMCQDFVYWRQSTGQHLTVLSDADRTYLEARLEIELGGVPVVAIPDALLVDEHGQLDIVDYKSGKPPRDSFQLGVYKAAVIAALDMHPTWGLYYMARAAQVIPVDLAKYTPEEVGSQFSWLDRSIKAEAFDPKPGDACRFCPYKAKHCRYYNKESE